MNKKLLYLTISLILVFGIGRSVAWASASTATASPKTPNASISGVVITDLGVPISGVTIQVSTGITATTDVYGSYTIPNLADGEYTLTPVYEKNTFTPPSRTVSVPPDATNQDFVYSPPQNPMVFLPLVLNKLGAEPVACQDFSDNFSDPNSGWHVGEHADLISEYLNGEYRVLIKPVDTSYLFLEPSCDRENYSVEVDARWEGNSGTSYGLFFGMLGDYDHYYTFEVNTDSREFRLARSYPGGYVEIVSFTFSSAIHAGSATNHLKATRNGTAITLEINGVTLGTWNDGNISGATASGVMVFSYIDLPNADARFDNFKVISLGGSAQVADKNTSEKQVSSGGVSQAPLFHSGEGLAARFEKERPIR